MDTPLIIRPLTGEELAGILDRIAEAPAPVDALVAAVMGTADALLSGAGLHTSDFAMPGSLDMRNLRIPKDQWVAIGEALRDRGSTALGGTNILLDWMNVGPSGYER